MTEKLDWDFRRQTIRDIEQARLGRELAEAVQECRWLSGTEWGEALIEMARAVLDAGKEEK